jgi:tetratricopeptide (TPR) repeat protein
MYYDPVGAGARITTVIFFAVLSSGLFIAAAAQSTSLPPAQTLEEGRRLLEKGAIHDAVTLLREFTAQQPDHAEALLLLGSALALVPEPSEAVSTLRRAVELQPASAEAHFRLGTALARFGDGTAARPHFERALALNPQFPDAHVSLALVLAQARDLPSARSHLARAIKLLGNSSTAAYPHYLMAQVLREQREAEDALEHLAAAISLRPRYAAAHLSRGLIKRERLDEAGALEDFETAVRLDPEDAAARAELGAAYLRGRRAADAIPHLEQALRLQPADRSARYHLCRALRLAGRPNEAEVCAKTVAEHLKQRAAGDVAAGRANDEAIELETAGNLPAALERYRTAVALDPFNPLFRRNLALALCRLGRWEEGMGELEQVLEADPNDQSAIRALYIAREQAARQRRPAP